MKRKHFILAFMAMLGFAFSAFAQQTVVVRNFAELKAEIEKTATESRANNMRGVNVTNQGVPSEIFGDIKLGDNIVMEGVLEIPLYRELTLDLNGFTISGDADEYIKNLGSFSVQDNSANGTGAISCAIINAEVGAEAYLKIQNGTFKNQDGRADAAVITNYSLCEIYGGKFFSENIAMINHGEMSIDGGSPANVYIEGKNHYITNDGTLAVKNATIAGAKDDYVGDPNDFEDTVIFYNVAVNGKGYNSLSEAVAAATDGDLIRLFANVEEGAEVVVDKAVTIDGNNKTLTSTSTGNAIKVNAEGIVSITDITVEGAAGYALDAVTETYVTESTLRGAGAVKVTDCLVSIRNTDLVGTAAMDVVSVAGDVTFNFEGGSMTASSQAGADKFFIVGGECKNATFSIMAPSIELGAAANYLNVDTEENVVKVFSGHETAFNQKGYVTEKKANFMYVYSAVATVNDKNYRTLAAALDAATDESVVELLWGDYKREPISMAGAVYGKDITITGTATVDWSKGFLFVGRGGEGNATVTFNGANLTSASDNASTGIHVSGREKNTTNKYDGTLVIKNSTIELDYLINRNAIELDNATLTVKNGFGIAGRPASETESAANATATISLANNSKVVVNNHNGMGLGQAASVLEGFGVMNVDATSAFETPQGFVVTVNGTMNIAGTATVAGTLTNNGAINLTAYDALLKTGTTGLTVNTTLNDRIVVYADGAYRHGAPVVQTYKANGELVWSYSDFESAIAAATANADIARIVVNSDFTQQSVANTSSYYDIKNDLVIAAAEGKNYTVKGCGFAVRAQVGKTLTIAENLTIEGLKVVANGFATSGDNMVINGTLKALSLKQWTSNGTITVNGKVELGYGDGQFDMAYGNGAVVVNGNGNKTEPQFKAGYSGTRGNGNTLTLNDTYFEAGAWFNVEGSNTTINVNNSLLKVSGGDNSGKLTIKAGNTINVNAGVLECANITLEEGAKIVVNGGTLKAKTVTNNKGAIEVKGESTLNIETLTGEEVNFLDGAIINESTIGGSVFVAGNVTFRGANAFAMLYDFGTLTENYGTTAPMKWTVEEGASVTLTDKSRYGLGYGDNVTIKGNIEDALTARENLTEADRSLFMHGLVAQESNGWDCSSALNVEDAYVVIGSNNSFGNKPGNYGGTYTFNIKNSVVDASRITFYEALSATTFTIEGSDVKMGTFMTRDADSKFILKNSKVLATTTTNGTDEGNYNKGELTLEKSTLTYSAEVKHEAGVINLDLKSLLTAPKFSGVGTINVNTEGITEPVLVVKADMGDFDGAINVGVADYRITDDGLVVLPAVACLNGDKYFAVLQDAIKECGEGDNTITLLKDVKEDVTVVQAPNVKITIDGDSKTLKGTITVDGKSSNYDSAALTIENVNFDASEGVAYDACVRLGDGTQATRYTNHVTVKGCTFIDNDYSTVAVKSYTAGDYNLQIIDCEADGMHSLAQLANVMDGLVISGNTVNTKNGINLNSTVTATIEKNTINVKGYAVRVGANGQTGGDITLTNNTLTTDNTEGDPVIELRGTVKALNMDHNAVTGATHIKGTATTIVADDNYWDNGDGVADNQPTVSGNNVKVNYYFDNAACQGEHIRNFLSSGSIIGYIDTNRVWGEAWGNAFESFVIKVLAANGDVMGITTYKKTTLLNGDAKFTWSLYLDINSYTGSSWNMEWTTRPTYDNLPASVQLWIDGEMLVEGPVQLNGPDGGNKINAAVYADDNTKTITAFYTTLEAAVAAGDKVAILTAGQYNVPVKDGLTVTGAVEGVEFANIGAKGMGGASVTFNNVTFTYAENSQYNGLQHAGNLVYNNCTINGQVFLYGESETFNNCTFNTADSNNYNVWTYGAKEVEFNNCTFNCAGKSVLIYAEGADIFNDVTVNGCQFIASEPVEGKAAIEMDSHRTKGIDLTISNSTVSGFGEGNVSGNSLWNNKKGNADNANNDITVTVDCNVVLGPKYEAQIGDVKHRTLQEAINAAVAMTGDVTIEIMAGTYANDINLTNAAFDNSNVRPNITFKPAEGAEVVLAGTVTLGYRQQNVGASMWDGKVTFDGIKFDHAEDGKHSLVIEDVKGVALTNCTLIGDGEYGIGSNSGNATTDATFTGCTFENGSMQVLGQLGAHLVVDGCECNGFSFNVQGGAAPGMTIKNTTFNMTLTDAHVGESFYAIRTNACPVNISGTTFNVDSEVSAVAADQAKWGLFWARKDAHAEWNITDCKVNFTDAAMEQTELLLTKNDAATYALAKDRMMITGLTSDSNDVEDLIKRGEGCATINRYRYLDGELDLTGMVAIIGKQVYPTLEEAIAAANAGETVTLLTNIEASEIVTINKAITLDGSNYTITSTARRVINVCEVNSNAVVTLKNLNMVSEAVRVGQNDIRGVNMWACDNVTLNLENCSVDFADASAQDWAYAVNVCGDAINSTINVDGGSYEGANVINVHGANSTVVVKDTELTSLYPKSSFYGACIWVKQNQGSTVEATGNVFNGINAVAFNVGTGTDVDESDNEDNTTLCIVSVGNDYYYSIAEAVEAAADGATVTLLYSVEGAGAVISKNLTIDFNGKEYTFTEGGLKITAGEVTLKNGTMDASGLASALVVNGGKVKIEGEETAVYGNIEVAEGATLLIWDGTYTMNVSKWCAPLHTAMPNEDATLYTIVSGITLIDGQFSEYTVDSTQVVDYIYYQRTLSSKKDSDGKYVWQAFYLPFEIPMSELVGKYEVTYVNDVRQSDSNGDGEIDGAVVEQIRIVRDNVTLKANYPYLIRPLAEEYRNFVVSLEDATLYKAQEVQYECSSIHTQFFFTGNVSTLDNNALKTKYALSGGKWQFGLNSMKPFRIYIEIRPKDGGEAAWIASDNYTIRMRVAGEEDETGATVIYDVVNDAQTVDYIYDLQGRRVLEPKKGGLYIINGKKVVF